MTRSVLQVTGTDRQRFLQGLVTNDMGRLAAGLVYAALLTPQGKYLADFFLLDRGDRILIDVDSDLAPALAQRLTMYRLRSDVQIAATDLRVSRGTGPAPEGALADPRDPAMGWRAYGPVDLSDATDWDGLRVRLAVPETGIELTPDIYILEYGFERLNGVDFRKGCYVGQEVTARMKHKTALKKGLVRLQIEGSAAPGTPITLPDGREAGVLHTVAGDHALGWLRLDRADGPLLAGAARLRRL